MLYAVEGWGKTSLAAHSPKPIFIQSRGETGLESLIQAGQVGEIPHFPECQTWNEILDAVDLLLNEDHGYRTLVIDTINGAERLCFEHVCNRDYGSDWGEKGFTSYGKGPKVAVADWLMLLQKLDKLRNQKSMSIFLLAHSKAATYKNPEGADFDQYMPDMDKETYAVTAKWVDALYFGNFVTVLGGANAQKIDKKAKAVDTYRAMYTQKRPAFFAKNRLGLPEEIDMGNNAAEAWANLTAALKAGRINAVTTETQEGITQ